VLPKLDLRGREDGREAPASRERRVGAIELIFIKFARDTKFRFDGKIYLRASARNIPVTFSPARTERAEMKRRILLLNPETSRDIDEAGSKLYYEIHKDGRWSVVSRA